MPCSPVYNRNNTDDLDSDHDIDAYGSVLHSASFNDDEDAFGADGLPWRHPTPRRRRQR